ncbi:hypothetical protein [Spirulina sp. 06S082]|uniref:hypothetical protein n=1 Tax=Spirulina sp. 06S082 TaxID=3110248 RepID=UPI002B1F67D4|nr:hypothetical protein [Spirulina sp. 06S082]MEA5472153.1 hypothetical protein [Spirulina sp. 06S082]
MFNQMFKFLGSLFSPITAIFIALSGFFATLIGAVRNPGGFFNTLVCGLIDLIASIFPETPERFQIATVLNSISDSLPAVGRQIVYDIAGTFALMALLILVVKVYRLLPFKAS